LQTASLAQTFVLRNYLTPDVRRIPVREGRVRGTLFLPQLQSTNDNSRRFPLVMTICNGLVRGHLVEEKAALLASKGG
jgi:hypothetical protein